MQKKHTPAERAQPSLALLCGSSIAGGHMIAAEEVELARLRLVYAKHAEFNAPSPHVLLMAHVYGIVLTWHVCKNMDLHYFQYMYLQYILLNHQGSQL